LAFKQRVFELQKQKKLKMTTVKREFIGKLKCHYLSIIET